jgi:hypothetical protein
MLLLILLLNVVLPFSSASQNATEATTEGAGIIRDDQSDIAILRILKTVGVALGVALVTIFIAPIIVYFLLCCLGFTCSGNNERIIAVPSSICVLIVTLLLKAFGQLRMLLPANQTMAIWKLEVVFLVHRVWALLVA